MFVWAAGRQVIAAFSALEPKGHLTLPPVKAKAKAKERVRGQAKAKEKRGSLPKAHTSE